MYTISLYHQHEKIKSYQSNVIPMLGDVYAGWQFDDGNQRTVIERSLLIDEEYPDLIIIRVDYSYPELVNENQNA